MNYLSLAVIGSGIAASWNYIKGIVNRFRSIFIVQIILEGEANAALMYLVWNEFKKSKMGDKRYSGIIKYVNPLKKVQRIGIEKLSKEASIFWRGWKPLLVKVKSDQYDNYTDTFITISYIRGLFNIDELLIEALDKYNNFYSAADSNNQRNRFKIVKLLGKEQVYGSNSEQKFNMAKHILKECPGTIENILNNSENDTPAKFQQKCADIALKHHWEKLKI